MRAGTRGNVEILAEREQCDEHCDAKQKYRLQEPERRDYRNEQYRAA
jgi:hypothetical protein